MPLPGDSSATIGHRYEGRWTARAIVEVLREDAQAIRLQPPGPDGEGIEFYVQYPDRRVFHQVKRQRTGQGDWTIAALIRVGVLSAFGKHLADPMAHCTFASAHSAASLEELSEKARSASSWVEYERTFLVSKPSRSEYAALKTAWNLDDVATFDYLRRVHVETVGEDPLRRWATVEAEAVIDGDQSKILATLVEIVLNNVNHHLTPQELWDQLAKYNCKPSMWRRPQQAAVLVSAANQKYIASRRATLIHGKLVVRNEAEQLATALASHRLVLVDGIAGMGKSDLLLHLTERLESEKTPYLAFRLDRTTPTRRPEELGRDLGLSTSPHTTLAAVAQGRNAVLIIDQLDAVSATSGRNPQFLECVDEIVRSAHAVPNVRIVLACRTFDMQNDARLRQLVELENKCAHVTVGPFARDQLTAPLIRMGYAPGALSDTQIELLRVPLHLALLAGGTTTTEKQVDFSTPLDLFEAFWRQKRQDIDQRLAGSSWAQVIKQLVDYMSDQQVLRAPAEIVDAWEAYADAMVSAHVLTRDGSQLAFFHESFFDYAFARTFIGQRGSIRSLLAQDQFLFRRGQVRQILAHERLTHGNQYAQDLAYLVKDHSVRFHLKDVVISWLAQVSPTPGEWALIKPLLLDENSPLFGRAWRTLTAIDWFKFADACGFIQDRLQFENKLTDRMVSILASVGKAAPRRVGEILSQFIHNPSWRERIGSVISQADVGAARGLFDLFLEWVDRWNELDPTEYSVAVFGHTAGELAKVRPDWGCELLGHFLENRIALARKAGFKSPFDERAKLIPTDLHLELFLGNLGETAPTSFMDHVWPAMLSIIEATSTDSRDGTIRLDSALRHRHYGIHHDLEESLLSAAEAAYGHVARREPERFERLLAQHRSTDLDTVIHLLYEAFRADPVRLAEAGIEFLLADLRRLNISYSNDEHWEARRLLESLTPFASMAVLTRLEEALLTYYPDTRWGHGRAQFTLLGGIVPSRRSPVVQKRIAEFQRKFGKHDVSPPEVVDFRAVRSPIPNDAARKMTDKQWLRAISKHAGSYRDRNRARDFIEGGAEELARVLQDEAKQDPTRFARLGLRLPNESNNAYFDALLRGITEATELPSIEAIRALIEKCHGLPNQPCGRCIAGPLRKYAASGVPTELLDIVSWYALNDQDPQTDRGEVNTRELDLMNHGLNSVRGRIAAEIAELIEANPAHSTLLESAIRSLVSDRVTAVRAMAAQIVCALVTTAPTTAQALFLALAGDPDDRLLQTRYVYHYLLWQGTDDFDMLRPVMERMIQSSLPEVRKFGAAHVNLAALSREEARDIADACLNSNDEALRMGAAMVFKSNLTTEEYAARCTAGLTQLFNDPSGDVRKMAGNAIWRLKNSQLQDHVPLARAFMKSEAFVANADDLIHALKETTAAVPELILETCEAALAAFEVNRAGPIAYQAGEAIGLVLRAYADAEDRAIKERALNLVDRALLLDIFDASRMLSEHDRWLGNH